MQGIGVAAVKPSFAFGVSAPSIFGSWVLGFLCHLTA
jgi:hypothetical protein